MGSLLPMAYSSYLIDGDLVINHITWLRIELRVLCLINKAFVDFFFTSDTLKWSDTAMQTSLTIQFCGGENATR
jgi:hypothetical protein